MSTPTYTLPNGAAISSGSTPTNQIPTGYSFDATGKLSNAQGQEYATPPKTTAQPTVTPIQNPVAAPASTSGAPAPTLPTPTAPTALQSFFGSATDQVKSAQAQADAQLAQRTQANQAQLDTVTKQQQDLATLQANGYATELGDVQKATDAKQAALDLEKTQYQQNYDLKQGFLTQMQDLVTKGNQMIEQTKQLPIASNLLTNKVNSTVSDLAAQVGSVQTLMSAADGQIAVAKSQLATTVDTVSSILQDQVSYFTSLQSFYSSQQKTNDAKIVQLTADQKVYLDTQLNQAQSKLAQVQKNAQALSDAMTNPDTALAYNQAGVTLNDTPEQINSKLATYAYTKELSNQSATMSKQGYTAVLPGQTAPRGADIQTVTDSKGAAHQYYSMSVGADTAYKFAQANALGSNAGSDLLGTPLADPTAVTNSGGGTGGGDILSATGLSLPVFNYLSQGSASLSRLSSPTRLAIMKAASDWAQKNNIDLSTFQSQYKAYNDVLQKNVERANNTSVFAGEVAGSADALINVISTNDLGTSGGFLGIGSHTWKAENIAALALGNQVNDETAQKYSFQLQAMTNDLAGYFAASRGANIPEKSDVDAASKVIANGLNAGSAQAFKDAITTNEQKVNGVVDKAVTHAQQQVWQLFGVGTKYQPPNRNVDLSQFDSNTSSTNSNSTISNGVDLSKFMQ